MKRLLALLVFALTLISVSAFAQAPTQCNGPADMCAQIQQLQSDLAAQKALVAASVSSQKSAIIVATNAVASSSAKFISIAAIIAVVLKVVISLLNGWSDYFKAPKGKAIIQATMLLLGFIAFLATNLGYGVPWWQAIILAGGAPGAILVHELTGLIPAIFSKGPLPVPAPSPAPKTVVTVTVTPGTQTPGTPPSPFSPPNPPPAA